MSHWELRFRVWVRPLLFRRYTQYGRKKRQQKGLDRRKRGGGAKTTQLCPPSAKSFPLFLNLPHHQNERQTSLFERIRSRLHFCQSIHAIKMICPDGCISKLRCTHTMEYYPALKRKNMLTCVTTCVNIGDIMLREISWSQKDKFCMILLIQSTWSSQIHRDRKEGGGRQGLEGKERGRYCLMGTELPFGKLKTFCGWMMAKTVKQRECT